MDTNPYANILTALKASPNGKLTLQQEADNYQTFSKLVQDGVYLPDLLKRIEDLERRVPENTTANINEELFSVMESAVKSNSEVKSARQKLADVKTEILTELCLKDERYKGAYDEYRTIVNAAYIKQRESPDVYTKK